MRNLTPPPASLGLDGFYRKWVDAGGIPVVGSATVSDWALGEAAFLIGRMLDGRDDLRRAIAASRVRVAVMAPTEMTTVIPEHRDLTPARYWDRRARGLGATPARPAVSCGEENLLNYPGDPYAGENILIHEFGHVVHEIGLRRVEPDFQARLQSVYEHAMRVGLWRGLYAATNPAEYWAEGVQSWFDCNQRPNASHNDIRTRPALRAFDPDLAALLALVFRGNPWRYRTPAQRGFAEPHLRGFDPAKAPRFRWDPALDAWYREYEAGRKKE